MISDSSVSLSVIPIQSNNPVSIRCRENVYNNLDDFNITLSQKKYFGLILGSWFVRVVVLTVRLLFLNNVIFLSTDNCIPFFKRKNARTVKIIHPPVFFDKHERFKENVSYLSGDIEEKSKAFRRSLYFVKNLKKGDVITEDCIRGIRPGYGLKTRFLNQLVGMKLKRPIDRGMSVKWECCDDC